jgi:hypothetical protein
MSLYPEGAWQWQRYSHCCSSCWMGYSSFSSCCCKPPLLLLGLLEVLMKNQLVLHVLPCKS